MRPTLRPLAPITALAILMASLLAPATALAVPRPGESCPDTTAAPAASGQPRSTGDVCDEGTNVDPGGGGFDLGGALPIIGAAVGGGVLVLLAAGLVLRRRAAAPAAPADPGEWWTCRKCGSNNVIGSPRCYSCGEWQS